LKHNKPISKTVSSLGLDIFHTLAHCFPVACSSDEFFYFPHIRLRPYAWHQWDDFSPAAINGIVHHMDSWIAQIETLKSREKDDVYRVDILMLERFCHVLKEQLQLVRTWQRQPSFYLLLANTGLSEALATGDSSAAQQRAAGLPAFFNQAIQNLNDVPELYRQIGLSMVADTQKYYTSLLDHLPALSETMTVLAEFEKFLEHMTVSNDFLMPADVTKRIFHYHLDTGRDLTSIEKCIDDEITAMECLLHNVYGTTKWSAALKAIALPKIGGEGVIGLYKSAVNRLLNFCLKNELIPPGLNISCPVRIKTVPAYLQAIRTASSYSIMPDYPPRGGLFSVFDRDKSIDNLREYLMLTAHEIYPGHHLLDASRLNLIHPVRRHIELPLFYEGWACFAEELLWIMGYFKTPEHRLLLAKRRFWRAIRGKIDLGLNSGELDLASAAALLKKTGRSEANALSTVKKYTLNPGYQICYTVGLRSFLDLYEQFGENKTKQFVQQILAEGEIGFTNLYNYFMGKDLN
jgi:uncharacterized protein (DUF885 family)